MVNLYVYCEGQTEESFVKKVLSSHFLSRNIILFPIIHRTKEGPLGIFKGGITDYNIAVKEIKRLCLQHQNEVVTSFMDYYGLHNIPDVLITSNDKYQLISAIEQRLYNDVGCSNFIPYISLHEFESLLFSNPEEFKYLDSAAVPTLQAVLDQYKGNPEMIDNGPQTAPSKRILNAIASYSKVLDGVVIANNVTFPEIRKKCKHFNEWLERLENTAS